MVQRMLQEYFNGKELCKSVNPDEAVAYGAAVLAAKLSGKNSVRDLLLVDVTPLSLAVELIGEVFEVMIPHNTPIPTKRYKTFFPAYDYQSEAFFQVYQGERARSRDNHLLGNFTIFGIPPAPLQYSEIETCFDIDANGILTVTAKLLSTGKTEKLIITNKNGRLSTLEIENMVKDSEKYKDEDEEFKKKAYTYQASQGFTYHHENSREKLQQQEFKNKAYKYPVETVDELQRREFERKAYAYYASEDYLNCMNNKHMRPKSLKNKLTNWCRRLIN